MKALLKDLIYNVLRLWPNNQGVVLMYHSITEDENFYSVKPQEFIKQMEFLAKAGYRVISLAQAALAIKTQTLPAKSVVITFDDGYEDNYSVAWPILKKFNYPATIFVSTSLIGGSSDHSVVPAPILTEDNIKQLAADDLFTIGSHAHNHFKLTNLTDNEIETELSQSKVVLEKIINREINFLAYPYGKYNQRVQAVAEKYYSVMCTVDKGRLNNVVDLWQVPRYSIDSQVTLSQFKGIVNFGRL